MRIQQQKRKEKKRRKKKTCACVLAWVSLLLLSCGDCSEMKTVTGM